MSLRHRPFATIVRAACKVCLTTEGLELTTAQIVLLGGIAGSTIFLGLPLGRLKNPSTALKASLTALAAGILVFLLIEAIEGAFEPVEEAVVDRHWSEFAGFGLLFVGGLAAGLLSLVYYERWMGRERRRRCSAGAASAAEFEANWVAGLSPGKWLALLIATGIGLHNFSEGLAIGQSGASGEIGLALLLIIGFGLHNATEGFGIVAPMSGERPSWRFSPSVIGGAPTFLGTIVGPGVDERDALVLFLALAAGSILYVVLQLVKVMQRAGHVVLVSWMILAGLLLGFGTELMLKPQALPPAPAVSTVAYASVYPLVTARSVARPFTYEVPDEVGPGAVVEVRFGSTSGGAWSSRSGPLRRRDRRGSDREGCGRCPGAARRARSVDGRVLRIDPRPRARLVAPVKRARRGQPQPAVRGGAGAGEAQPSELSESQRPRWGGSSGRWTAAGRELPPVRRDRQRQTEVYLQACDAALERGWARSCSSPRSG